MINFDGSTADHLVNLSLCGLIRCRMLDQVIEQK